MARPRKENAEYFSHDTNMRSHRKIIALRWKFWIQWYAVYCMLLEHIWSCDFFISKRDDIEQEVIAGDFGVTVADLVDIVNFCGRMDLLQVQDWKITCGSLVDRLSDLIEKRNRERTREKQKEDKIDLVPVAETIVPVAEMPQSKVKETKVNNIFIPPTLDEIKEHLKTKWYNDILANKFFDYFTEQKRKVKWWKQMQLWKSAIAWWYDDRYKIKYTPQQLTAIVEELTTARQQWWPEAVKIIKEKYWKDLIDKAVEHYNNLYS